MSFVELVAAIAALLKYTPAAYAAVKAIIAVWEEQTDETITDEQWQSIDEMLKPADDYVSETK